MDAENRLRAAEILRSRKIDLGATWPEIARFLGDESASSLRVYASNGNHNLMPSDLADKIIAMESTAWVIERISTPDSKLALAFIKKSWRVIPVSEVEVCACCGEPFFVSRYGQKYCNHDCRLQRRREVYVPRGLGIHGVDLKGKYAIVNPGLHQQKYKPMWWLVFHCDFGFGCNPNATGKAVAGFYVADNENVWKSRDDLLRLARPEEVESAERFMEESEQ